MGARTAAYAGPTARCATSEEISASLDPRPCRSSTSGDAGSLDPLQVTMGLVSVLIGGTFSAPSASLVRTGGCEVSPVAGGEVLCVTTHAGGQFGEFVQCRILSHQGELALNDS